MKKLTTITKRISHYLPGIGRNIFSHKPPKEKITKNFQVLSRGIFRLHYATEGPHAIAKHNGAEYNDCPERVEDTARQLEAAFYVFCTLGGLRNPLDNRFFHGLSTINFYFFNRAFLNGYNGLSFNMPSKTVDTQGSKGLAGIVYIANDLPNDNLTPAHEFFHQIQSASTQVKNLWFYEGMARWSESFFTPGPEPKYMAQVIPGTDPSWTMANFRNNMPIINEPINSTLHHKQNLLQLLYNKKYITRLLESSYDAAFLLWLPIASLCVDDQIHLTESLRDTRRYCDGSHVLKSSTLRSARIMKDILEGLGQAEKHIRCEPHCLGGWTEKTRRAPQNNRFILEVVRRSIERFCD